MCGLCGELRFDGASADLEAVKRMTARLERRGPDHEGSYSDGVLGFGHRRLAIIDLSEHSNQPLVDMELGLALVFNGTIYNYRELRRELQACGYHFFSEGDSEIILKAYREWGAQCVERFSGMFAFAVWDMHQQTLFMARDRFGIKPFYWNRTGERFRFASSVQALLAGGGVDTSIDPAGLHFQYSLHAVIPAPRTLLRGIRKLEPAHWMRVGADGSVDRTNKNANDYRVEVSLMQTSLTNDALSAIAIADQAGNTGVLQLAIKDLSGTTTFFAEQAWIGKQPDPDNGDTAGNRTWALDTGIAANFIGGN